MSARTDAPAVGLHLSPPWLALPLDADDPPAAARREVAAFLGRFPGLSVLEDRFVDELVVSAAESRQRDTLAGAFNARVTEDGGLLEGWLEVSIVGKSDLVIAGSSISDLVEVLAGSAPDDTRPRECERRDLPAGSSVRVRGSRDTGGHQAYVVEYLEYWLPEPEGERIMRVSAMTPSVGRSDQFVASADELVETLTIRW